MNPTPKILIRKRGNLNKLQPSPLDVALVRAAIIRLGMNRDEFAERVGLTKGALSVALSRNLPHLALRKKIENVLNFEISLGSDPQNLMLRARCQAVLGFDFDLLSKVELIQRCQALGMREFSTRTTELIVDRLFEHFAANPKLLNP